MSSKDSSFEEKPTETVSRCYDPQGNRNRIIRLLTVAVYVLCVSLAAIMLSLYYIFIWDPAIRPFVAKGKSCERIVIPEKIAIRLLNSSEVTAEQFYHHILEQYRILNQLQIQRQQFFQKQHLQLQQLAASNRFQEIFATATIIQANPDYRKLKPITPTNGTFLLDPRMELKLTPPPAPIAPIIQNISPPQHRNIEEPEQQQLPILDAAPPVPIPKRKAHRKHTNHHRHNSRKYHKKELQSNDIAEHFRETPLNPPSPAIVPPDVFTSMPIPLILNSNEADDQRMIYARGERNSAVGINPLLDSESTINRSYLNPLLNGELIFEK